MANVDIWTLRVVATKKLIGWSHDQFDIQGGQEEIEVNVDEDDLPIFGIKYRFNPSTGDLEINDKEYYILDFSDDASSFSPEGIPQINVGGQDGFDLTVTKKDIQGNSHTSGSDDDTLNVQTEGGSASAASVDLVNGQVVIAIESGIVKGKARLYFEMDGIKSNIFEFQTI